MNKNISVVMFSRAGNEDKASRMTQFIIEAYHSVNQIILVVDNEFDVRKIEKYDFLSFIQSNFDSPWSKAKATIDVLIKNNLILLTPDDDYFLYVQEDLLNFSEGGFDYACINYAMVKKSIITLDNEPVYELFNAWKHHLIAANIPDVKLRIDDFVDQGVATFWGLYSYKHFKSSMNFASYASMLLSRNNIDLTQIIEDCENIINLASKMYCASQSWCLRMLDRKSTNHKTWLSSAVVFQKISIDFTETKYELTKSLRNIINDISGLHYSDEHINDMLERHVNGYISANSRIWRDGLCIFYLPNVLNKNSIQRVMINKLDKDDVKIFIVGDLLFGSDIALKYSWVNKTGFKQLFNLTGPQAILNHKF